MKMGMKVVLQSIRNSKNDPLKVYADFVFLGGSFTLLIDPADIVFYKGKEGQEMEVVISVRPRQIVSFDRPVTLFEPVALERHTIKNK